MRWLGIVFLAVTWGCTSSNPAAEAPAEEVKAPAAAEKKAQAKEEVKDKPVEDLNPKGQSDLVFEADPQPDFKFYSRGVHFANVKDGDTIANGFELEFVVIGKSVAPAGEPIDDKTIGHHHLIIDAKGIEPGTPVPADASHIHFGKGQTKHILNVAPGQHTLTLQFADGAHRSYGPEWAKTITVTVTESKK